MKPNEVLRLLNERIVIGWPFKDWGATLRATLDEYTDDIRVTVKFPFAPHRDTGDRRGGPVCSTLIPPCQFAIMDDVDMASFIRGRLVEFVLHELDESILVDGKRVFDPHDEKARRW